MHVEAGHSAVPEEGPKDLRCPLCLYHTKYKRNMIDHIVLHRGNLLSLVFLGCKGWEEGGSGGIRGKLSQGGSNTIAPVPVPPLISPKEITVVTPVTANRLRASSCWEDFLHLEGGKGDGVRSEHFCGASPWERDFTSRVFCSHDLAKEGVNEK